MNFLKEFLSEYGTQIVMTLFTAVAGAIGVLCKNIYKRLANDRIKKQVAETCVTAVEQLYKELTGSERYEKCVEAMREMLNEKGIEITDLEIKMLIESAVGEFNNVFYKETLIEETKPEENDDF